MKIDFKTAMIFDAICACACPDYVIDKDTEEDGSATCRAYGKEMTDAVKKLKALLCCCNKSAFPC